MPDDLDEFTRGYLEAALWAETDNADDQGGEPLDANYDAGDIDPATLEKMKADCRTFQADNRALLKEKFLRIKLREHTWLEYAGHDFWFSRNGHGAGFFDGDWDDEVGEKLTEAAEAFGPFDLYVGDDHKIYGISL